MNTELELSMLCERIYKAIISMLFHPPIKETVRLNIMNTKCID